MSSGSLSELASQDSLASGVESASDWRESSAELERLFAPVSAAGPVPAWPWSPEPDATPGTDFVCERSWRSSSRLPPRL